MISCKTVDSYENIFPDSIRLSYVYLRFQKIGNEEAKRGGGFSRLKFFADFFYFYQF